MMKNITMNLKHLVLTFTLAIFAVAANAATVTYRLTTHSFTIDGQVHESRTITGTANLAEGADLLDNMPQDLWRGYTTYKFYSNSLLTKEITTVPEGEEEVMVYVDYEFDPPFLMSNDSKTVWNYIRNYVEGGSTQRYLYYDKTNKCVYQKKGANVNSNQKIQWAFYGDGYDFNIKLNDSSIDNPWLIWGGGDDRLQIGAKQQVGWQIYANAAKNDTRPGGTVCIGRPDNGDLMYMPDLGIALNTQSIDTSVHHFDSHHQLVSNYSDSDHSSNATKSRNKLWSYAFFASTSSNTQNIWHVTYRIQKQDGTWYNDIVIQKNSDNLTPVWPTSVEGSFTPIEDDGYNYESFYTDATFKTKFTGSMTNDRNSILYIREYTLLSKPWRTLVIPFTIRNVADYFDNKVTVLKYNDLDATVTENASETNLSCKLIFTPFNTIEAYHPYLFKADDVKSPLYYGMFNKSLIDEEEELYEESIKVDGHEYISVSMKGVLDENGYLLPNDGLHFFFGSYPKGDVDDYENYTYKFYRQGGVTIPQFVCYFYVSDERTGNNAPIKASFGTESITGVSTIAADIKVQNSIYSLDGRKIDATSLDNLKRGIYIVNGRKVVK